MAAQAFTGLAVPNTAGLAMSNYSYTVPNLQYGLGLGNSFPTQQPSFTASFHSDSTAPHLATKSPLALKVDFEKYFKNKPLLSNYLEKLQEGKDNEKAFGELFDDIVNHVNDENQGRFSESSRKQLKKEIERFYFDKFSPKAYEVLHNPNDNARKTALYRYLLDLADRINTQLTYRNLSHSLGRRHGGRKITRKYRSRNGKKTSLRKLKQRSRKHGVSRR